MSAATASLRGWPFFQNAAFFLGGMVALMPLLQAPALLVAMVLLFNIPYADYMD